MNVVRALILASLALMAPCQTGAAANTTTDIQDSTFVPANVLSAQKALYYLSLPAGLSSTAAFVLASDTSLSPFATDSDALTLNLAPQTVANVVAPLLAGKPNAAVEVGIISPYGQATYGFGAASGAGSAPPNGDSQFEIASITKTFTGTLLGQASLDGLVNLNGPAQAYMPQGISLPSYNGQAITLTNLATHTSGLAPNVPSGTFNPSQADFAAFVNGSSLAQAPGASFNYSNVGAALAGQAADQVFGLPYQQLLQQNILGPLGMSETSTLPLSGDYGVQGYDQNGNPVPLDSFNPPTEVAAGGLKSTANDMLKYLAANVGLTPTALYPAMQLAQSPRYAMAPEVNLGLFWISFPDDGQTFVYHAGGLTGASSDAVMSDPFQTGVVIFYNYNPLTTVGNSTAGTDIVNMGNEILDMQTQLDKFEQADTAYLGL